MRQCVHRVVFTCLNASFFVFVHFHLNALVKTPRSKKIKDMTELAINEDGLIHYCMEYTQGNIFLFQSEVTQRMRVKDSTVCFITLPDIIKIGDRMHMKARLDDFTKFNGSYEKDCNIIEIDPNHHNYAYMLSKEGAYMARKDLNKMIIVPENSKEELSRCKRILIHKATLIISKHNFTSREANTHSKPIIEYTAKIRIKETFERNVLYVPIRENISTASTPS